MRCIGWKETAVVLGIFNVLLIYWLTLTPSESTGTTIWRPESLRLNPTRTSGDIQQDNEQNSEDLTSRPVEESVQVQTPVEESVQFQDWTSEPAEQSVQFQSLNTSLDVIQPEIELEVKIVSHKGKWKSKMKKEKKEKRPRNSWPPYPFLPEENPFVGDANIAPTAFELHEPPAVEDSYHEICDPCFGGRCSENCQVYQKVITYFNQTATKNGDARLHVFPIDPLVWAWKSHKKDKHLLQSFVTSVKSAYPYFTFKGSDHVFVCLTNGCQNFGKRLSRTLAGRMGSRAIFAGVQVNTVSLKWPCPLRVISLEQIESDGVKKAADNVLQTATFMIEKRNRWICSDQKHPENHWQRVTNRKRTSGAYISEFGFSMCAIPKCGSSMTNLLLRRVLHYKNWNQTGTGMNHGPRSGIPFVSNIANATEIEAVNKDLTFVKGVVVRNPLTRLLSGYLDKIYQKKQYFRIRGLSRHLHNNKPPSFREFVKFLISHHPNPHHLDTHFSSQSKHCKLNDNELDFVAKLDNLNSEMKEFGESLGFWEEYGASGFGENGVHAFGEKSYQSRTHDSGSLLWKYYSEDLMMDVYNYYKEDFDRFGFSIEEILATNPQRSESS